MKTKEKLHAIELSDKELAKVTGGDKPLVDKLTDDLLKSGNYMVSTDWVEYNDELYAFTDVWNGMGIYCSPTGKTLFIPNDNR